MGSFNPTTSDSGDATPTAMDYLVDTTSNLHLDQLTTTFPPPPPPFPFMGVTSTNPCVDFFFQIKPSSSSEDVINLLQRSWNENPLTTLKLVCNLRVVGGTGKSDIDNFYTAAVWLHENHPKTLACNVEKFAKFAKFGYFKDLLEILAMILEGREKIRERKKEWLMKKRLKEKKEVQHLYNFAKRKAKKEKEKDEEMRKRLRVRVPREKRVAENRQKMRGEMVSDRAMRKEQEISMAKRAYERYKYDENYRFLHDQIAGLFAKLLISDVMCLMSGEVKRISLAAKWCPSIDSLYDKITLLCKSIAERIFPREEYEGVDEVVYVLYVRYRLRNELLMPLHQALQLPEVYKSAEQWDSIEYERVASLSMKSYIDIYLHRDIERFKANLEKFNAGDEKIARVLLPFEIIAGLKESIGARNVTELQWKRMVGDLLKKGKLTNCLAVCDVSMSSTPIEVRVALGLLVSELSKKPWKGHVITFSHNPQLHLVKGDDLKSKTEFIAQMEAGFNMDFQKVFDKILEVAVNEKLSEEQMIKRLFVFSDVEFDQASTTPWETDHQAIQRKFKEKGFEKVPEIVFWNLRNTSLTPVMATQYGVTLVNGFSKKNLLTLFLEEGGATNPDDAKSNAEEESSGSGGKMKEEMNPESVMEAAISGELYQELFVYD